MMKSHLAREQAICMTSPVPIQFTGKLHNVSVNANYFLSAG